MLLNIRKSETQLCVPILLLEKIAILHGHVKHQVLTSGQVILTVYNTSLEQAELYLGKINCFLCVNVHIRIRQYILMSPSASISLRRHRR